PLRALREHAAARDAAGRRVETMQADRDRFAREVGALARARGIAPQDRPADTFAALQAQAAEARARAEAAATREDRIARAETERQAAAGTLRRIAQEVAAIAAVFPDPGALEDIDRLREAAGRATQLIADRARLEQLRREVTAELGVPDVAAARACLAGCTPAALEAETAACEADLARAEAALVAAIETRAGADLALARITGEDGIAALAERRATLELELEAAALEHLELSLGHALASDAIRRYRDSHRSAMMTATEGCFARLTGGAYPALMTQIEKEAEILLAVDAAGASKRAAEMSKGTRFQLYLALRAAAHEQMVAQGTRLPFFCDDIFETFDEDRTGAACQVMEEIGRRGQAIYLTHHRHVVEIAKRVCDTPPVIHEL
ncbi:ATP-binding protein, partial [Mangrovicoccus algicola]|nr:hypothetical protein [Mangrovicoccus algicola]